jgi:antitoxin ParD1/3/4
MSKQSITLTEPNDEWLKKLVESQEYTSKSEIINDLIKQSRRQKAEVDWLRSKIERAESSGFTNLDKESIRQIARENLDGKV